MQSSQGSETESRGHPLGSPESCSKGRDSRGEKGSERAKDGQRDGDSTRTEKKPDERKTRSDYCGCIANQAATEDLTPDGGTSPGLGRTGH